MLRLDLNDNAETVLFIDPMKEDIKIRKAASKGSCYEFTIETCFDVCHAFYDTETGRDDAYERVLNKINEYLFSQIESELVTANKE